MCRFEELIAVTFRNVIQSDLGRGLGRGLEVYTIRRIYKTWVLFVARIYMVGGELHVQQE